jgi:2'-hydroxyisoflavone reductase
MTVPGGIRSTASSTLLANIVISPGTAQPYGDTVQGVKILVMGGTSFVGRHFVERALERGHDVTLFNRGKTAPEGFPDTTVITGDRDGDLKELSDGEWEATVDVCAYVPRQVRSLLEKLGERSGHYTFISTISVYGEDLPDSGFTEDAPLLEPAWDDQLTMEKYGELKVACEQVARELAGDRLLIIRPGYVIGPYDPTHRFTYWVERVAAGGPMVGGDADQPLQGIDGRDLAALTVGCVERRLVDTVTATAPDPAPTFREVLDEIARGVGKESPDVTWIGPRDELPLTAARGEWPAMRADLTHARDHGLWWRPMHESAQDTLAWVGVERAAGRYSPRQSYGFPSEQERALLNAADQ